jgi:hypothetical protein
MDSRQVHGVQSEVGLTIEAFVGTLGVVDDVKS